jgi:hypothetical protein
MERDFDRLCSFEIAKASSVMFIVGSFLFVCPLGF